MKKAFTLIELLVVTLVIAILASILFKLAGSVEGKKELQTTIIRMQKLENCLSGYYAAFGCYPPVPLQGRSRNPFYPLISAKGPLIQDTDAEPNYGVYQYNLRGAEAKGCVEAACRAQPVEVVCPYSKWFINNFSDDGTTPAEEFSAMVQHYLECDEDFAKSYKDYTGGHAFGREDGSGNAGDSAEWRWKDRQTFCFGLLSFLLPRYLLMMGCENSDLYALYQWDGNNSLPCRFESGVPYRSWVELNDELKDDTENAERYRRQIELIPSQAVTQRWLPNLEEICSALGYISKKKSQKGKPLFVFYNINIAGGEPNIDPKHAEHHSKHVYGSSKMPNFITVVDGWDQEFFYYSPPPYQNYRLWSSGKNKVTFPPWFTEEEMKEHIDKQMEYIDEDFVTKTISVKEAIADDIVHLSH